MPWVKKEIDARCATCKWWEPLHEESKERSIKIGRCRRFPPQVVSVITGVNANFDDHDGEHHVYASTESSYPRTEELDACGEHSPAE